MLIHIAQVLVDQFHLLHYDLPGVALAIIFFMHGNFSVIMQQITMFTKISQLATSKIWIALLEN